MSAEIETQVREIIVEQLDVNPEDISPEKRFSEDLDADSLRIIELALAFEEKFNIKIPDDEVEKIKTVGDAINYIKTHAGG